MEFLRVSDQKAKIILSREECVELGIFENDSENEIFKKVSRIISRAEEPFDDGEFEIRLHPRLSGGLEISLVSKRERAEIHTFVFDEKSLEKALKALKNTDFQKNSALYKTQKTGTLIWEILARESDAFLSRLSDFARQVELSDRRDYLAACAERIPFPVTEDTKNGQSVSPCKNT